MEFHLVYEGLLYSTQKDPVSGQANKRASHKHDIRRQLLPQLKQLWATNSFLRQARIAYGEDKSAERIPDGKSYWGGDEKDGPMAEVLAQRFSMFGYRFVPLVREDISVRCSLEILFLRRDHPGTVIKAGDIDNRLKTFFDALRIPKASEMVGNEKPQDDEDPFYVLLEDDSLITRIAVETGMLLDPPTDDDADVSKVRMLLTVNIRPYHVTMFNLSFA